MFTTIIKTEIISGNSTSSLQTKLNEFLAITQIRKYPNPITLNMRTFKDSFPNDLQIIDIKYEHEYDENGHYYSALVIYRVPYEFQE